MDEEMREREAHLAALEEEVRIDQLIQAALDALRAELDEGEEPSLEAELVCRVAAELVHRVVTLMQRLDPDWPRELADEAGDVAFATARWPDGRLVLIVGEDERRRVYAFAGDDAIQESTTTRWRLIGPDGVLHDMPTPAGALLN